MLKGRWQEIRFFNEITALAMYDADEPHVHLVVETPGLLRSKQGALGKRFARTRNFL
jgi:hypothetical protein